MSRNGNGLIPIFQLNIILKQLKIHGEMLPEYILNSGKTG